MTSYKAAILTENPVIVPVEKDKYWTFEELDEFLKESKQELASGRGNLDEEMWMSETIFKMMDYMNDVKESVENDGYMNSFTYKDVAELCRKCLSFKPLPVPEHDSEDEISEYEDDYISPS